MLQDHYTTEIIPQKTTTYRYYHTYLKSRGENPLNLTKSDPYIVIPAQAGIHTAQ